MENLKELLSHPGWQEYLDVVEAEMLSLFMELFQLESDKPDNYIKFVSLKSKIDTCRNLTYFIERQVVDQEDIQDVDKSYGQRFMGLLKKLWRKDA